MNNELVQTGHFDLEPVTNESDEIIIDATWASLSDEEFDQAATEYHGVLDQQENVLKMMTNEVIRKKGELYMAYKAKQGHGKFIGWLDKIGISPRTAQEHMQTVRELGDELSNTRHGAYLGFNVWRKLARSTEGKQIVAKIEAGEIEPTPKAVNAEIEAAKQREMEAKRAAVDAVKAKRQIEEEYSAASQQLSLSLENAKVKQSQLEKEIAALKLEKENMARPQEKIVYDDKPETIEKLAKLQEKELKLKSDLLKKEKDLEDVRGYNARFAEENRKLTEQMRASYADRQAVIGQVRIREEWRKNITSLHVAVSKFVAEIPSLIDQESLEGDDWARHAQCVEILQHALERLQQMRNSQPDPFVDATVVSSW
jgi:hypothetical protein